MMISVAAGECCVFMGNPYILDEKEKHYSSALSGG